MNVTELRPGNYFEDEGNIYEVMDILLNKTAMRKMVAKVKVKNLRTGSITEIARNSGYDVSPIFLEKKTMSYLYDSGTGLVFMDQNTYEQVEIDKGRLTWELNFLKEGQEISVLFYGEEILGIVMPIKVTLQITECEPAVKGDTINNTRKNAVLETGYQLKVPLFVNNEEFIIVRTDTGEYDSRASNK